MAGIPLANRREARKLGLLHKQKFRSRTRAKVAAGANERVCGECPTQDAHPNSKSGFTKFIQERVLGRLYLGINNHASLAFLVGNEGIDVKIDYFRMVGQHA